jgi:DNA-binding protein HU-beta
MKRHDIINAIADSASISKTAADATLHNLEGLIAASLVEKGEYHLLGVGKLKVKTRAARTGRNPKTGAPIQIAESKTVTFTPAKALKEILNP